MLSAASSVSSSVRLSKTAAAPRTPSSSPSPRDGIIGTSIVQQDPSKTMAAHEVQTLSSTSSGGDGEKGKTNDGTSSSSGGNHWQDTLETLQSQILAALSSVDKERVDVTVGRTSIQKDRAVILAWNRNQNLMSPPECLSLDPDGEEDGLLLYLAIRYKKGKKLITATTTDTAKTCNGAAKHLLSEKDKEVEVALRRGSRDDGDDECNISLEQEQEAAKPFTENDVNNNTDTRVREGEEYENGGPQHFLNGDLHSAEDGGDTTTDFEDEDDETDRDESILKSGQETLTTDEQDESDDPRGRPNPVKAWIMDVSSQKMSNGQAGGHAQDRIFPDEQFKSSRQRDINNHYGDNSNKDVEVSREGVEQISELEGGESLTNSEDEQQSKLLTNSSKKRDETPSAQKKKKSVRWKERLEETSSQDNSPSHHQASSYSKSTAQGRSRKSRRDHHMEAINRAGNNNKGLLQRTSSLDEGLARNEKFNRPKSILKRTRSNSTEYDGPVIVLTSKLPTESESASSSGTTTSSGRNFPQVRNMIRRIRTRHVPSPSNLWFSGGSGSESKSFNSRCSDRFDINDLAEDSRHYFYFRSLPKVSPPGSIPGASSASASPIFPPSSAGPPAHVQGKGNFQQQQHHK